MNAHHRLAALYEEWRLMTESEGDAIRSLAWQRVEHCQRIKTNLREQIVEACEHAAHEVDSAEAIRQRFRPILEHLIGLELRNSEWLAAERRNLEVEQEELNRSHHTIRQLRGTYGSPTVGAR
jgi:hypothetical protein